MEALIRMLQAVHPMSDELIEYLSLNIKVKELAKKELLLKAGHICRHIYFIDRGCYAVFIIKEIRKSVPGL